KVNGSATLPVLTDGMDATFSLGIAALTLPNAPHNTNGTTIANPVDERPTDAVWRNGRLWFVATYNTGTVDGARATMLATGAGPPTVMRFAMPTSSSAATQGVVRPSTLPAVGGSSPQPVAVKIAWGGTLAGSGATFQVSQNIDGAGFESFSTSTTATSIVRSLAFGHSYQFEVRVRNAYGDISAWQVGPTFTPTLYQQTSTLTAAHVVYAGTWTSQTSPNFSGGSAKFATAASASATFVATSVRAIGFVTTQATTRGSFKVYVDGVLKATVSAYTATTTYR